MLSNYYPFSNPTYTATQNKTFSDMFPDFSTFQKEYNSSPLKTEILTDKSIQLTYYLLYGKRGNDSIINLDENQWKYRFFSVMFKYGPTWQQRLNIQSYLQTLDLDSDELKTGNLTFQNYAEYNGSSVATTDSLLTAINSQTQQHLKRGKIDSLQLLTVMLQTDVTEEYLMFFNELFSKVGTQFPILYETNKDYGVEEDG